MKSNDLQVSVKYRCAPVALPSYVKTRFSASEVETVKCVDTEEIK